MNKDEHYYSFLGKFRQAEQDFENRVLEIILNEMENIDNECTRHE